MARRSNFTQSIRRKKKSSRKTWRKWQWKNTSFKSRYFPKDEQEQHDSSVNVLVGCKRKKEKLSNSDSQSGVSPLIRDRLGLQECNGSNNLSVFDRLGFKKDQRTRSINRRSGFKSDVSPLIRYGLPEPDRLNNLSVFDRLGCKKRNHCTRGTLRRSCFKSGLSPVNKFRLKWLKSSFQQKQPEKTKYRKRGSYQFSKVKIFVKIDNDLYLHKIDELDDMHETHNDDQPQTDADSTYEEDGNNECLDNLQVQAVPDFVSETFPAGIYEFDDGIRSFQSVRICVELYPTNQLGSLKASNSN